MLRAAKSAALRQPPHAVAVEQLLEAMLGEGAAIGSLREAGADPEDVRRRLAERAASAPWRWPGRHGTPAELSVLPRVQHVLHRAVAAARGRGRAVVGIEDLLLGPVGEERSDARVARRATVHGPEPDQGPLALLGLDADRLEAAVRG